MGKIEIALNSGGLDNIFYFAKFKLLTPPALSL